MYQKTNFEAFLLNGIHKLDYLDYIKYSKINDSIITPDEIFECKQIHYLKLSYVDLNTLSNKISQLKNLEVLVIEQSHGEIDSLIFKIYKLPKLKALHVNSIVNSNSPKLLYLMQNLEELSLFENLDRPDPKFIVPVEQIIKLKKLKFLVVNKSYAKIYPILLKKNPNCLMSYPGSGCLAKGTQILQSNNKTIAIENLKIGDILLAYNEQTKSIDTTIVTKTFEHLQHFDNCLNITVEINGKSVIVQATNNHPFYTQEKQWITAGELTLDMHLLIFDATTGKNEFIKISSLTPIKEGLPGVYNIETSKHNYFANGILVHNK